MRLTGRKRAMGIIKRSSATSLIGWLILAVALLSAISVTAYAMTRSGAAKPPKRSLASAVHRIFTAKPAAGVSAQFRVDQHLLAGTSTSLASNPLLQGATGSVWVGGGHARLVLKSQLGTTAVAYDGRQVTPPAGTKVVHVHMPNRHDRTAHKPNVTTAVGRAAASKAVGFPVLAPATLAGLPQHHVRAIGIGSRSAALVTYGRGLGTVFLL